MQPRYADADARATYPEIDEVSRTLFGITQDEADDHVAELRRRDNERFTMEVNGGPFAGRDLVLHNLAEATAKAAANGATAH